MVQYVYNFSLKLLQLAVDRGRSLLHFAHSHTNPNPANSSCLSLYELAGGQYATVSASPLEIFLSARACIENVTGSNFRPVLVSQLRNQTSQYHRTDIGLCDIIHIPMVST